MKIVKCSSILNVSNTTRNYYNIGDVRISDVYLHNSEDVHPFHQHKIVTEVLYVLQGSIQVKIKENNKILENIVNKDEIVRFDINELHTVSAINDYARVLVFKYVKSDKNLSQIFSSDYGGE